MTDYDRADEYTGTHRLSIGVACLLLLTAISTLPLVGYYLALAPIVDALHSYADWFTLKGAEAPLDEGGKILFEGVGSAFRRGTVIGKMGTAIILLTAAAYLVWTYRCHRNLRALGGTELKFTPFWAVGWWFIPFLHFYRPFQVMDEIWSLSDPAACGAADRKIHVGRRLLWWWWALVAFILATIYARFIYWGIIKPWIGIELPLSIYFYFTSAFLLSFVAAIILNAVIVLEVDRRQRDQLKKTAAASV